MSAQSILVLTGIVSAFLAFGISLAWADFYTQQGRKPVVDEHQDGKPQSDSIEEGAPPESGSSSSICSQHTFHTYDSDERRSVTSVSVSAYTQS